MTLAFFTAQVVHSLKAWVADFSSDDFDEPLELLPLLLRETFDAIVGRIRSLQNAGTFSCYFCATVLSLNPKYTTHVDRLPESYDRL